MLLSNNPVVGRSREIHASSDSAEIEIRVTMSHDSQASGTLHFQIKVDAADLIFVSRVASRAGRCSSCSSPRKELTKQFVSVSSVSSLVPVNFSLTAEQVATALRGGIEMREALPVNQDIQRVRLIVYDRNSSLIGWLTIPVAKP